MTSRPVARCGSRDQLLIERDRRVTVALGGKQLGNVFSNGPMSGVCRTCASVVSSGFVEPASAEVEHASLEFQPGIRTHLLGRELVLRFNVEPVGCRGIA